MACTLQVARDDQLTAYNFGARHPMTPVRVELTIEKEPPRPAACRTTRSARTSQLDRGAESATERPFGCGSDGMPADWDLRPDRRIRIVK